MRTTHVHTTTNRAATAAALVGLVAGILGIVLAGQTASATDGTTPKPVISRAAPRGGAPSAPLAIVDEDARVPQSCATSGGGVICLSELGVPRGDLAAAKVGDGQVDAQTAGCQLNCGIAAWHAADIRSMYRVPDDLVSTSVVGIVVAGHHPTLPASAAYYRSQEGLVSCAGCLSVFNQSGAASPSPPALPSWTTEATLDVEMVSAVCPTCRVVVVEANTVSASDMDAAVQTAVSLGAQYVSMSWGSSEQASDLAFDPTFAGKAVTFVAASGDTGYPNLMYPATSPHVVSAGGTLVSKGAAVRPGGWIETTWSGTGSGCSTIEPALPAQAGYAALKAVCAKRATADIAAVADSPDGGVAVAEVTAGGGTSYYPVRGTSVSAPIITALYALAGNNTNPFAIYDAAAGTPSYVYDVASGATTGCDATILCQARRGWDGPTGLGAPVNVNLFNGPHSTPYVYPTPTAGVTLQPDPTTTPTPTVTPTPTPTPVVTPTPTSTLTSKPTATSQPTVAPGPSTRPSTPVTSPTVSAPSPISTKKQITHSGSITLRGHPRVGETLRARYGTFRAGKSTPHVVVRWYAGTRLLKTTGTTIKVSRAVKGKRIHFTVTATKVGYAARTWTSGSTARIR